MGQLCEFSVTPLLAGVKSLEECGHRVRAQSVFIIVTMIHVYTAPEVLQVTSWSPRNVTSHPRASGENVLLCAATYSI